MNGHRTPYVGEGADGARRSAEIDRTEAETFDRDDPRVAERLESATRWEAQAADLELDPELEVTPFVCRPYVWRHDPDTGEAQAADLEDVVDADLSDVDPVAEVLEAAEKAYARARRDTPTGTIIGRLDPVTQRAAWLELRRTGIGSSDVPALLGISSGMYAKSELDLYMDKRGELKGADDEAGEAALWGNLLEDPVAREWARRHGVRVERVGTVAHLEHRHMLCDLDRRVIGCPDHERCAVEVKTRSAYKADDWRDGAIPEDVEAQTMWQLAVTGFDAIHVAPLIGGQRLIEGLVVYPDADYIADLFAIADQFWTENVSAGVPPAISALDLLVDHLKHLTPAKGVPVEVAGAEAALARDLTARIDAGKAAVDDLAAAELELKALIGDAGTDLVLVDDNGNKETLWTWRSQNKPKALDKAALAAAGINLEEFKVPNGTTRVLRRVKAKEAK